MPSPIGHALAGIAVAWTADLVPGDRAWRTAPRGAPLVSDVPATASRCSAPASAAAPDLDLAFAAHRTVTHSLAAVAFVGHCRGGGDSAGHGGPVARIALMCAAAYALASAARLARRRPLPAARHPAALAVQPRLVHLGRRPLPADRAPRIFTHGADADQRARRSRRRSRSSARSSPRSWLVRVKALAGLATELAGRDHPAQ